jgi:hypothetical protein
MRLFLDTEFNGFGGELISMAVVPETGDFWYEVCDLPANPHPWVKEHVLPVLDRVPLNPDVFRMMFHIFITQFTDPEIYCDWHADAEHFFSLLAGRDYGSSLDFACTMRVLKTPKGAPVPVTPHNALSDARALKDWYLNGH